MNTAINRNPSTTIAPTMPTGLLPLCGDRLKLFKKIYKDATAAFGYTSGMTCVDATRAYFQKDGDRAYYSVTITPAEADMLGYIPPATYAAARRYA